MVHTDGAACVHLSSRDADFSAEAKFTAIGELGRRIVQYDRAVEIVEEMFGCGLVLCDD